MFDSFIETYTPRAQSETDIRIRSSIINTQVHKHSHLLQGGFHIHNQRLIKAFAQWTNGFGYRLEDGKTPRPLSELQSGFSMTGDDISICIINVRHSGERLGSRKSRPLFVSKNCG